MLSCEYVSEITRFSGLVVPKLHVVAFGYIKKVAEGYNIVLRNKMFAEHRGLT